MLTLAACGHHAGQNVASGTIKTIATNQAETANNPSEQISRVAGERAVAGAVASLHEEEQREKLRELVDDLVHNAISTALRTATEVPQGERGGEAASRGVSPVALLISQAARAAVADAARELIAGLGGRGEGPLAASLEGTGRKLSAAAVGSAVDRLRASFPGCSEPDLFTCIDRRIGQASRTAAVGFSTGVRQTLGWPLLLVAGAIGIALGLVGHWLWSLRSNGRGRALRPRTT